MTQPMPTAESLMPCGHAYIPHPWCKPCHDTMGIPMPETQPMPTPNEHPPVWRKAVDAIAAHAEREPSAVARSLLACVAVGIEQRAAVGRRTYGVDLQPHNGRDAMRDAYEEALDAVMYLTQAEIEADGERRERCREAAALAIALAASVLSLRMKEPR